MRLVTFGLCELLVRVMGVSTTPGSPHNFRDAPDVLHALAVHQNAPRRV